MIGPSAQLEALQNILMKLPDEMQRTFAKQRNRKGAVYTLLSDLTGNTAIPIFTILRLNQWRKWEEENWNILWQRYNETGQFPLVDLVEASMFLLDGLKQKEIERMTKGFWSSRLKVGSNEHWVASIEATYRRRKDNLERADRILRAAPEIINRFQRGELTFEQARRELKQKMGEGLRYYERTFGSLTLRGAARYLWATVNQA